MRIIAGEFRRRLLLTPRDAEITRPIPDRVKESLFGLLRGHCEGATVFDGFAGTGAIGLEAISRGAQRCVMVEQDRGIAEILRKNVASLGVEKRCEVVVGDALGAGSLARAPRPLTIAFLDPPYPLVRDALGFQRVMDQMRGLIQLLTDDGFAILRTPWPLQHVELEASAEPELERKRWKKKGKGRRRGDEEAGDGDVRRSPRPAEPCKGRRGPRVERLELDEDELGEEWIEELDESEIKTALAAGGDGSIEEGEAEDSTEGEPDPPAPKPVAKDADLRILEALGPETHVYGGMAVHLYMRRKG